MNNRIILFLILGILLSGCSALYVVPNTTPTLTETAPLVRGSFSTLTPTGMVTNTPEKTCRIIDLYKNNMTTVNMHREGSMNSPVVKVAKSNEVFTVIGVTKDGWIETNSGFIYQKWCK